MKKDGISLLALMLAAAALVLSIVGILQKPAADCGHTEEIAALQAEVTALQAQLDEMKDNNTATVSPTGQADLFVHGWEEKDGTLTVTEGFVQIQLGSGAALERVQLVLLHNGTECGRADIAPEAGSTEGLYQHVLLDTWFMLPQLNDDDLLELKLEVTLTSGDVILTGDSSWYATGDGLYAVVG